MLAADDNVLAVSDWFSERWLEQVLVAAPERFDGAFDRWRDLFRAATRQFQEAQND